MGGEMDATPSGLKPFKNVTQGSSFLATAGLMDLNPVGIRERRTRLSRAASL
jgi:hypothetical protein